MFQSFAFLNVFYYSCQNPIKLIITLDNNNLTKGDLLQDDGKYKGRHIIYIKKID